MIIDFTFIFPNLCVIVCFLTKLLTSGILFSTAVNAELITIPITLGLFPSISVILAFKSFFLAISLVSGIFFSKSDLSVSYRILSLKQIQ